MQKKKSRLIRMSDITTEQVQWLWYPYIPYGKVTIIQGDPGEGKTSFVLAMIALLTNNADGAGAQRTTQQTCSCGGSIPAGQRSLIFRNAPSTLPKRIPAYNRCGLGTSGTGSFPVQGCKGALPYTLCILTFFLLGSEPWGRKP